MAITLKLSAVRTAAKCFTQTSRPAVARQFSLAHSLFGPPSEYLDNPLAVFRNQHAKLVLHQPTDKLQCAHTLAKSATANWQPLVVLHSSGDVDAALATVHKH